jgi:predicted membrane protein
MEKVPQKDNSRTVLAFVLIGIGMFWLLRKIGIHYDFLHIHLRQIFYPFRAVFTELGHFIFSWQVLLIIVGLLLMAGRRSFGIVLIIAGGLFLIPKIFFIPQITISFLLPAILIGVGIAMIARFI